MHSDEVLDGLRLVFGQTASVFIERLIIREITREFELNARENFSLTAAMEAARKKFLDVSD
jgi:hypothetical protein